MTTTTKISEDLQARIAIAQLKWPWFAIIHTDDGNAIWIEREQGSATIEHCSCGGWVYRYISGRFDNWCQHLKEHYKIPDGTRRMADD